MKKILAFVAIFTSVTSHSQPSPLSITEKVANYIVANTPFEYRFSLFKPSSSLASLQALDWGRNFGLLPNTLALASTEIVAPKDTTIILELSHSSALQLVLNQQVVYTNYKAQPLAANFLERTLELDTSITLTLHKGSNSLLAKAFYLQTSNWKLLLQCSNAKNITIGLGNVQALESEAKQYSNFLIAGPITMSTVEKAFQQSWALAANPNPSTVYEVNGQQIVWTIPKLELTQKVINPQPFWGSYYNYNYHTAGVAWAIAELGNLTGNDKYKNFTTNYCNFILQAKPLVTYQVRQLWQTNSTDYLMVNTPLLDFTSAPAMPFLYKLITEPSFKERNAYNQFFQEIKTYIFKQQIRLPQGNFTRETPEKFTTWVDDMFMGLPFVIHCAKESKDPAEQKQFQDDAAKQVLAFASVLFDTKDSLFHHARHSNRPQVQYPYWLRANGWGIWAITEVLKGLPKNHPSYNSILALYKAHIYKLAQLQDASGMWHNIANRPDARLETSGSSIITLAIARGVNEGWLNKEMFVPIAIKGWQGITQRIEADGQVNDIIVGSFTSEDYQYYEHQAFVKNDSHGMLCVLMCGIEMQKLVEANAKQLTK